MEFIDPSVYERADEGLRQLIKRAEVGALSEKEYDQYEASMKLLADEIDMEKQGYERGVRQGMEQGILQVAKELKTNGVSMEIIMKTTHLSQAEIEKL
jgi:predicted transposase/invertase (TIGR01784 family)